jgi:hypothetical protein
VKTPTTAASATRRRESNTNEGAKERMRTLFCFKTKGSTDERQKFIRQKHDSEFAVIIKDASRKQLAKNAKANIEYLIEKKMDETVPATARYSYSNAALSEYKSELKKQYTVELDFDNLSNERYLQLATMTSVSQPVLLNAMRSSRVTRAERHPGPSATTCPICIFKASVGMLDP